MASRLVVLGALLVGLALPLVAPLAGLDYMVGVAARVLILALAAVSLNLILGYGGMVSFGHAAFFGIGAYTAAILSHHAVLDEPVMTWPLVIPGTEQAWIAWPAAMLVAAVIALPIGALSLRTSGLSFIMITLAFAQMLFFLFVSLEAYGGGDGLSLWARSQAPFMDLGEASHFYYLVLGILCLALVLKARLIASRFGFALQGIRDNERRMRALGFATYRYKLAAFVIAGAVAGLAGALMANHTEFVSPALLSWQRSGEILVIVVLGGMGTLFGPVAGAVAYLLLEELLSQWTQHWMVIFGPLLVLAVLFARQGVWGLIDTQAQRHG